jgi:hypothetical protein
MKKRIISAILSACMMLSCIVAADYTANAVEAEAAKVGATSKYKLLYLTMRHTC